MQPPFKQSSCLCAAGPVCTVLTSFPLQCSPPDDGPGAHLSCFAMFCLCALPRTAAFVWLFTPGRPPSVPVPCYQTAEDTTCRTRITKTLPKRLAHSRQAKRGSVTEHAFGQAVLCSGAGTSVFASLVWLHNEARADQGSSNQQCSSFRFCKHSQKKTSICTAAHERCCTLLCCPCEDWEPAMPGKAV